MISYKVNLVQIINEIEARAFNPLILKA